MTTQAHEFKTLFPQFCGPVDFYTSDGEQVNFINVEEDQVEFTTTGTASCGCCSEIEEREEGLSYIMDCMSREEFQELIETITL